METDAESFCCAEAYEIHKEMFEGKLTLCASNIILNNATLFQYIYSNKLSLGLICLFFSEYLLYKHYLLLTAIRVIFFTSGFINHKNILFFLIKAISTKNAKSSTHKNYFY